MTFRLGLLDTQTPHHLVQLLQRSQQVANVTAPKQTKKRPTNSFKPAGRLICQTEIVTDGGSLRRRTNRVRRECADLIHDGDNRSCRHRV